MNKPNWIFVGAMSGALAVMLGAFGAHGLESHLTPKALDIWEVAVRYHFYHVFALIFVGSIGRVQATVSQNRAGWLFALGTCVFSGSLYALALSDIKILGAITPLGGLLLIAGWIQLALASRKSSSS